MRLFAFYEREKTKVGRTVIDNYRWAFSKLDATSCCVQLIERERSQAEGYLYDQVGDSTVLHLVESTILPVREIVSVVNQFQSLSTKYMTQRQLAIQGIIANETMTVPRALQLFQLADNGYISNRAELVEAYEYMVCRGICYAIEHGGTSRQIADYLQLSANYRPHQLLIQDCLTTEGVNV